MTWTYVGVGAVATTQTGAVSMSPAAPAGSGGILFLLEFWRDASIDHDAPTGWTDLNIANARIRLYGRVSDGGVDDTPTLSSGTSSVAACQIARFSGVPANLTGIVNQSTNGGITEATNRITTGALTTPSVPNCLIIYGGGLTNDLAGGAPTQPNSSTLISLNNLALSANDVWMPWSYTIQTTAAAVGASAFVGDDNAGTPASRYCITALIAGATAPVISSVSNDEPLYHGKAVTVLGYNFGASQGGSTLKVKTADGAPTTTQTVTSWSDTQIVFTLNATPLPLGAVDVEVTVSAVPDTYTTTLVPAPGFSSGTANVPWPAGGVSVFDGASAAVVDGDIYEYEVLTDQLAGVSVLADGTFIINSPTGVHEFDVRVFDQTDETWSAWTTAVVSAADSVAGFPVRTVYTLSSVAGLRRWVDYIPVKVVTPTAAELGTFNDNGGIVTTALGSTVGKTAWVDYIPVYIVTDPVAGRWRSDDLGWIPVTAA